MNHLWSTGLASVIAAGGLAAQAGPPRPSATSESGVYGELYRATGGSVRRPGSTLRAYASPTFTWMGLTIGVNLLWSTEEQFVAQSLNRYYVNPRWSWGQAHAGDWVPSLSRFTASAVRLRGAGVELTPGRFRASLAAGRAQQASDLSPFDATTTRAMYAGLVGYGNPTSGGPFIELSALRAVDGTAGVDTLSAPPQENLVAALAGGTDLFGGRLRLKGEGSASLFSRDIRAGELDSIGQPGWTGSVFTPRVSSRLDYAWNAEARLAVGRMGSVGAQLEYVGPGFTTLGNPYFANDRRETRVFGAYRFLRGRLNTAASLGERRDNLAGDKRGTTLRRTGTLSLTLLSGRWLVSSASLLLNGMTRDPDPLPPGSPDPGLVDSFRLRNVARSATLVEQLRFEAWGAPHTVTLSLADQRINDASPRFGASLDALSRSVTLDYSVTLAAYYIVSARSAYQRIAGAAADQDFTSFTLGVARRAAGARWGGSLTATLTPLAGGTQLRNDAMATYRLSARDQLTAQLRHTRLAGGAQPFRETLASLRLAHRW